MKGKAAAAFAVTLAAALAGSVPAMAAPRASAPPANVKTFGTMHVSTSIHLTPTHLPHLTVKNNTYISNNWSGYAITARGGKTIPSVTEDFTVPSVNCANTTIGTSGTAYVADWAGLDGLVDNTVEQEGVDVECTSTTTAPTYIAWYEMYPLDPVAFTGVNPGDAIAVTTQRTGSSYVLTLTDITNGGGFTTTQACPSGSTCKDNSAEVITEDPGDSVPDIDLADFGMDNQTGILAHTWTGLRGSFLTCNFWISQTVEMVDPSDVAMDTLSPLYGGQAFGVTWSRSG